MKEQPLLRIHGIRYANVEHMYVLCKGNVPDPRTVYVFTCPVQYSFKICSQSLYMPMLQGCRSKVRVKPNIRKRDRGQRHPSEGLRLRKMINQRHFDGKGGPCFVLFFTFDQEWMTKNDQLLLSGPVGSIIYADLYGSIKIKFPVLIPMRIYKDLQF